MLREAEVALAQGKTVVQLGKQIGVSEQTYYLAGENSCRMRFEQIPVPVLVV